MVESGKGRIRSGPEGGIADIYTHFRRYKLPATAPLCFLEQNIELVRVILSTGPINWILHLPGIWRYLF